MQTNSTINANSPQFSHKILSLTDSWSFTITFIAMIIGYIRGLWYFTSHPLDQSLISSVAGGWGQFHVLQRHPTSSAFHASFCYSFAGPAPSLYEILSSSTKSLKVLESQYYWEQPSTNGYGSYWIKFPASIYWSDNSGRHSVTSQRSLSNCCL